MHGTLFATSAIMIAFAVVATNAANPPYGQLSVKDCKLTGSSGQPVQLRGMSLFWSVWMSKYWNQQTIHVWLLHRISIILLHLYHFTLLTNLPKRLQQYMWVAETSFPPFASLRLNREPYAIARQLFHFLVP